MRGRTASTRENIVRTNASPDASLSRAPAHETAGFDALCTYLRPRGQVEGLAPQRGASEAVRGPRPSAAKSPSRQHSLVATRRCWPSAGETPPSLGSRYSARSRSTRSSSFQSRSGVSGSVDACSCGLAVLGVLAALPAPGPPGKRSSHARVARLTNVSAGGRRPRGSACSEPGPLGWPGRSPLMSSRQGD